MRAAFHEEQGEVSVLRVGQLPDAVAGPGEVLIRVQASSLDRVDIYFRTGSNGMRIRGTHIGGRDAAGTVEAIGPQPPDAPSPPTVGTPVVGLAVRGAHAELVAVPAELVFPIPDGCSYLAAAATPTAGRTAYDGLINRGRLAPGEQALVVAGGSGVGSFGIQITRAAAARVIATVGADWKAERALALGASAVINHHTEDVAKRVAELTDGRLADVVLDPVGAATFPACFRCLADDGRYVTTGVTAGHRTDLHLGQVFARGLTVTGVGRPSNDRIREVMFRLLALVASGDVKPVVHEVLPLEEIAEAHRMLESSAVFGKLVLTVARP